MKATTATGALSDPCVASWERFLQIMHVSNPLLSPQQNCMLLIGEMAPRTSYETSTLAFGDKGLQQTLPYFHP